MSPNKSPLLDSLTPFARLLFSVLLIIACFAATFLIGMLLAVPLLGLDPEDVLSISRDYGDLKTLRLLQYLQVLQSFGLFIIPALLAGYLFARNSPKYLGLDRISPWHILLITVFLMFAALPFINWMVSLNETFKLPSFLAGVENWMKATEAEAAELTDAFMKMPSGGAFLFNILMIALLPAIGEELLFRGLLQRQMKEWLGSIHAAIWISAALFSALHMQFYGFLPRMMLGALFGYLYCWTGSLWVPVLAHFINNAGAVIVEYLGQRGMMGGDYENFGTTGNGLVIAASVLGTAICLWFIYRLSSLKRIMDPGDNSPDNTLL